MKKQAEITERTRQRLMDAFWELYTTRRVDQITVKEIVNKAGCNRSTFYEYFQNMYDVLNTIENQVLLTLNDIPPFPDAEDGSASILQAVMGLYRDRGQYLGVLLGDNGDLSFQRRLKDGLKDSLMERLQGRGSLDTLKIDLMLEYILSGLIGVMIHVFEEKPEFPPEELLQLTYGLFQGDELRELYNLVKVEPDVDVSS